MSNNIHTALVFYGCAGGNGEENFVALVNKDEVLYKTALPGLGLAQTLSGKTSDLLRDYGGEKPDAISVVTGPGSFTGLRSTIAIAQGLGLGWGVPVLGSSLYDAMYHTISMDIPLEEQEVEVLHHARKGYVYALDKAGSIKVLSFQEALDMEQTFVCGNAVDGPLAVKDLQDKFRVDTRELPAHPDPRAIFLASMINAEQLQTVLPIYGEGARISKPKAIKV